MILPQAQNKFQFLIENSNPKLTTKRTMLQQLGPVWKSSNLTGLKQQCPNKILEAQIFSQKINKAQKTHRKKYNNGADMISSVKRLIQSCKNITLNFTEPFHNQSEKNINLSNPKRSSLHQPYTDRQSPLHITNQEKSLISTKAGSEKSQKQNLSFGDLNEINQIIKTQQQQAKSSNLLQSQLSIKDFDLLNFCGEGVFGSVFIARHKKTNFICALKKVLKTSLKKPQDQQSLIRQIKIHLGLNHPNIINFYGCFSNQTAVYFALQLCQQGNLYQALQQNGIFTEKQVRQIIWQVCNGIDYLHSKDIIHRDIKAQNIVMQNKCVKICDFGWATEGEYSRKSLCGTPAYISPQLIQNKIYDKKIDIWSLGVLTFELLYGKIPFDIKSPQDFYKVVHQQLSFPQTIQVSVNCKNFIKKCLEKDSFKRWDTSRLLAHPFLKKQ